MPVLRLLNGPKMGFSPLAAKLVIGSKTLGCKNGTVLFYHLAKYGGDPGSGVGCRPTRKSVMFLFRLSVCHALE